MPKNANKKYYKGGIFMLKKMKKWVKAVLAVVLVIVILVGVLAINTITFKSKQFSVSSKISYPIDTELALKHVSESLQIPTVSNAAPVDYSQFTRYREYLEKNFPLVHSTLERQINNNYNLIYIWKGSDPSKKPVLLLSHYDVFSVTDKGWKYPAFSGTIAEGYVWGRGALDDKSSGISYLEAVEYLIKSGFKPTRTIYIAFGQDEEGGGRQGAQKEAEYFKSQGLQFEAIMDEGLFTVQGGLPGLPPTQWITLIGIEEKGFLNLRLTAEGLSGHSSMPPEQTSIGILSAAIDKLEKNPFPARWPESTTGLLKYVGPETSFPFKMIFANKWLFGDILLGQFAKNPKSNAMIRTTIAPTVFNAGEQPASMPQKATAVINFRLMAGDTIKSVTDRVAAIINDPRVKIEPVTEDEGIWEVPSVSNYDSWSFNVISKSAKEVMPDAIVSPSMVTGGTDGRYFSSAGLSKNWYRMLPAKLPLEDISGMHGANERILTSSYIDMVNFYIRLMQNFSQE